MKSDPQVPAAVDAAPPAALNKAVEVTPGQGALAPGRGEGGRRKDQRQP